MNNIPLGNFLSEYTERNTNNAHKPVAVGRYGIRTRESIYSKELAKDYSKNKLIFKDTLTVGMGSVQIDIGVLSTDNVYSVSPAYHTYRINGINPDYLRYCLECRNQDMFVRYVKKGSRQGKTIDLSRWLTYEIPVYSQDKQKEIATRIDSVQKLVEANELQLAKLDELVKSRFVEMFENDRFPYTTIGNLIERKVGAAKKDFASTDTIKYIDISSIDNKRNMMTGYTEYILADAPSRAQQHICKGDIVVSTVRPNLKNVASTPFDDDNLVASSGFCVLRPRKCLPSYLMAVVCSDEFTKAMTNVVTGANYPAIKDSDVMNYPVRQPPMDLQQEFAAFVAEVDKSKLAVKQSLEKLETLKKSLMQQYFG